MTRDAVLGGRIRFFQPRTGYRVNVDSILLARFSARGPQARLCLDLGAGVGPISLVLQHLGAAREHALIESGEALLSLARKNLREAGARARFFSTDLGTARLPPELVGACDLVVTNPPFFEETAHRSSADASRRRARFGALRPFLTAATMALGGRRARLCLAYPARALGDLVLLAATERLVVKRLRLVHAFSERPARLALVELRRARPGGLMVEPPLIEWLRPRVPSPELSEITGVGASGRKESPRPPGR